MASTTKNKSRASAPKTTKSAAKPQPKAKAAKPVKTQGDALLQTAEPKTNLIDAINHEQVAKRAFEIWHRKGCPAGCDVANWTEAEKELISELMAARK